MKVSFDNGRLTVQARCPSWSNAMGTGADFRDKPPEGYKLIMALVEPRTRGDGTYASGARCNLELMFEHCDSRVAPFTEAEAQQWFRDEGLERPSREFSPDQGEPETSGPPVRGRKVNHQQ